MKNLFLISLLISLVLTSEATLEDLKKQIEEKRKLLQMLTEKNQQPNSNLNQFNLQSPISESHPTQIRVSQPIQPIDKSADIKETSEIKSLLKSIIDMQYYSYQMLSKMKTEIEILSGDVSKIKIQTEKKEIPKEEKKSLRGPPGPTKIKLEKIENVVDP